MLAIQPQNGRNVFARGSHEPLVARPAGGRRELPPARPPAGPGEPGEGRGRRPRRLPPGPAAARLGAELRRLRLERGISQRGLTRLIGLSAHSNLGEYERGTRIPPRDIVVACEQRLSVPAGYLQRLQEEARRERARRRAAPAGQAAPGRGGR